MEFMSRKVVAIVTIVVLVIAVAWVSLRPPLAARELYEQRCTSCHILPDMCRFPSSQRAVIVQNMRIQQQANQVITETELARIIKYLQERLPCQ